MKKSLMKANIVICLMIVTLVAISVSNARSLSTSTDSRVVSSGNMGEVQVCFVVSVAEGTEYIEGMLDVFDLYGVKTTFFLTGSWVTSNIDLACEIYSRGHEIANNGFYQKDSESTDFETNVQEISLCHKVVSENLGIEMSLYSPVTGEYNLACVDAATSLNYTTIICTHDTQDTSTQDSTLIAKRATKNLSNGDFVLLHPTEATLKALTQILSYAINNGFEPSTITECIK